MSDALEYDLPYDALDHLESLSRRLTELGDATLDMLSGREPVEPSVLIAVLSAAVVIEHETSTLPFDDLALDIARRLLAASNTPRGAHLLDAAVENLDLGEASDLDPQAEPAEQVARLFDIYELAAIRDLLKPPQRAAIDELLERNTALVVFESANFEALSLSAATLSALTDFGPESPLTDFLESLVAATSDTGDLPTPESLVAGFSAKRAEVEANLPLRIRWRDRLASAARSAAGAADHVVQSIHDLFTTSTEPRVAWASSGRFTWPRYHLPLSRRGELEEAALVTWGDDILIEWIGFHPPFSATANPIETQLEPVTGPLGPKTAGGLEVRYWRFPEDDTATHFTLHFVDSSSWSLDLVPVHTRPVSPPPPQAKLDTWRVLAPGQLANRLRSHAEAVRPTHLGWSLALSAAADAVTPLPLEPLIGRAWFPCIVDDPDFAGVLIAVDSGRLNGTEDIDASARVRAWISQLLGLDDHPALASVGVQLSPPPGLRIDGTSHELACAIAALSRLLETPPNHAPVLSGRLGSTRAEVQPVDATDRKAVVASLEAPGTFTLIVDTPLDLTTILADLFGDDWHSRLLNALKLEPRIHAREAARAWQRFFRVRSVLALSEAERARALAEAELALTAFTEGPSFVQARWVRGAMRLHRGESSFARADLEVVRRSLAQSPAHMFERWTQDEADAYLGIALIDQGRPTDAVALLRSALDHLDAEPPTTRDLRWQQVRLQVAGSLARALGATDQLQAAIDLARESLGMTFIPDQRARSLMDLAELERRHGDLATARATLARAREALDAIPDDSQRNFTERFLSIFEHRSGLTPPIWDVTPPGWRDWPTPAATLETLIFGPPQTLETWLDAYIRPTLSELGTVWLLVLLGALGRASAVHPDAYPWLVLLANALQTRPDIDSHLRAAATLTIANPAEGAQLWARISPY